jgi:hypothetical protein
LEEVEFGREQLSPLPRTFTTYLCEVSIETVQQLEVKFETCSIFPNRHFC